MTDNENKVTVETKGFNAGNAVKIGVSFGTCLAMVIPFVTWKSVGWAILHGIFSWGYVLYFMIRYVWM
jgi:cell division septal protein FtsQ